MKKNKIAVTISSLVLIIFAVILVHGIFNLTDEKSGINCSVVKESINNTNKGTKEKGASIEVSSFVRSNVEDAADSLDKIKNQDNYNKYLRKYLDNAYEKKQLQKVKSLSKKLDSRGQEILNNYETAYDERNSSNLTFKPGEVIVIAKKNQENKVADVINDNNGEVKEILNSSDDTIIVKSAISLEDTVKRAVNKLETANNDFEYQPNFLYKTATQEEGNENSFDPQISNTSNQPDGDENKYNWYISRVKGFKAIDEAKKYNNSKVKVAVIDTGADIKHKSLRDNINIEESVKVLDGKISKLKCDSEVHGTHVTGIITGKYSETKKWGGMATDFVDTFVIDSSIQYNNETLFDSADLIMSLDYAMKKGAKIINMSLGGFGRDNGLAAQIQKCLDKDIVVVCAAGNENTTDYVSPADFPNVISVINSNYIDEKAFSNYGIDKDISAPGEIIYSTIPGNRFMYSSGTSMAAPVVTSVCALIRYVNPKLNNEQIRRIVYSSSEDIEDKGFDIKSGFGRVNALEAVNLAVNGS
ncbi:MAG: S8 family serine peptidase, partial [Bacilli bacterium]